SGIQSLGSIRRPCSIVWSKWAWSSPVPSPGIAAIAPSPSGTIVGTMRPSAPGAFIVLYTGRSVSNTGGDDSAAAAQRGDDDGERRGLPWPGHRADRLRRGAGGDPHDGAR